MGDASRRELLHEALADHDYKQMRGTYARTPAGEGKYIEESKGGDYYNCVQGIVLDHYHDKLKPAKLFINHRKIYHCWFEGNVCWLHSRLSVGDSWFIGYYPESWEQRARRTWDD